MKYPRREALALLMKAAIGAAITGPLAMGCGGSSGGGGGAAPVTSNTTPAIQRSVLASLSANSTNVSRVSTADGMKISEISYTGGKLEGTSIVYLIDGQRVQDGAQNGVDVWPENKMVNVGQNVQWVDLNTGVSMPKYTVA